MQHLYNSSMPSWLFQIQGPSKPLSWKFYFCRKQQSMIMTWIATVGNRLSYNSLQGDLLVANLTWVYFFVVVFLNFEMFYIFFNLIDTTLSSHFCAIIKDKSVNVFKNESFSWFPEFFISKTANSKFFYNHIKLKSISVYKGFETLTHRYKYNYFTSYNKKEVWYDNQWDKYPPNNIKLMDEAIYMCIS